MNTVGQIWNFIVTSNFFNFVVMVLILAWIVKKVNLGTVLENAVNNIKNIISKAEEEKTSAEKELLNAQKSVENLDFEIKEKIDTAEKQAEKIAKNINALDAMGNSVASAQEMTGLIPDGNDTEAAEEFYDDIVDFLPHGVIPQDKYSDSKSKTE